MHDFFAQFLSFGEYRTQHLKHSGTMQYSINFEPFNSPISVKFVLNLSSISHRNVQIGYKAQCKLLTIIDKGLLELNAIFYNLKCHIHTFEN